jgi:hypothetical protein
MFRGNNSRATTSWLAIQKAPLQIHSQIMRNVTKFFDLFFTRFHYVTYVATGRNALRTYQIAVGARLYFVMYVVTKVDTVEEGGE